MAILLISQTFLIALLLKEVLQTSWFSLVLFLVFIGGLMVLFTYITSLSPNEPLSLTSNKPPSMALFFLSVLLGVVFTASLYLSTFSAILTDSYLVSSLSSFIHKIYAAPLAGSLLLLFLYLLLTLFISVFIILTKGGPLRACVSFPPSPSLPY